MKRLIASTLTVMSSPAFGIRNHQTVSDKRKELEPTKTTFLTRQQHLQQVRSQPQYDIVVIGGGCVGAGVLLDAAARGYKCLLVEASDFSSGASSKSTKLIHGGVRYLQQVFELSTQSLSGRIEKYNLVKEALEERSTMINNAPYMNHKISIVIPCRNSFWSAYYYIGSVVYHMVYKLSSKDEGIKFNFPFFASRDDLRNISPYISDKYGSGVVYEDGQFNDSQMNLALLLTATVKHPDPKITITPANILNQAKVLKLLKQDNKVNGVTVLDRLSGKEFDVKAKYVVNCTGVFADSIRKMDDPHIPNRIIPVAGSHMTYSRQLVHRRTGICIPSSDGRILLVLPWMGKTIVGTTEKTFEKPVQNPTMSFEEKEFIVKQLLSTFDKTNIDDLYRMNSSSWTGLRPLVLEEGAKDTKSISRKHVVERTASGLYSLMGGKWTTYRKMAEDLVDEIEKERVKQANSKFVASSTRNLKLIGSHYASGLERQLADSHPKPLVDHLIFNYGGLAEQILKGNTELLDGDTLVTKAEIDFIVQNEMPNSIDDVVLRRTRVCFLDNSKAEPLVEYVAEALARAHGWTATRKQEQINRFRRDYEKLQF